MANALQYMQFDGPSFQMQIPTTWQITSSPQFQAMFIGQKADPNTTVRPNLMVTIRPVEDNVTPTAVAARALQVQSENYPEFELLGEVDYTQQGGVGVLRQFVWRDAEQDVSVTQMQAFFVFAGLLYTLTGTRQSDADGDKDDVFTTIINSFRLAA